MYSFYKNIKLKRLAEVNVDPLQTKAGEIIMGNNEKALKLNNDFVSVLMKCI